MDEFSDPGAVLAALSALYPYGFLSFPSKKSAGPLFSLGYSITHPVEIVFQKLLTDGDMFSKFGCGSD